MRFFYVWFQTSWQWNLFNVVKKEAWKYPGLQQDCTKYSFHCNDLWHCTILFPSLTSQIYDAEKMDIHQSFFYFTLSWCYYYFADTALVGSLFFTLGSHKNTTEELLGKIIDCKCQRIINNNSIDQPFLGIDERVKKRIEGKLYY